MPSETIHIRLLDEGTLVFRPVAAERLHDGTFRILGEVPDSEEWAFRPGEIVVTKGHMFSHGIEGIVADQLAFDPTREFQNWGEVERSIDRAFAGSPVPFDSATISNVRDLFDVIRARCPIPEAAGKGYWSTICISWEGLEVEVFGDDYELYQFFDGRTDIEYFYRGVGSEVPAGLIDQLPRVAELSD